MELFSRNRVSPQAPRTSVEWTERSLTPAPLSLYSLLPLDESTSCHCQPVLPSGAHGGTHITRLGVLLLSCPVTTGGQLTASRKLSRRSRARCLSLRSSSGAVLEYTPKTMHPKNHAPLALTPFTPPTPHWTKHQAPRSPGLTQLLPPPKLLPAICPLACLGPLG